MRNLLSAHFARLWRSGWFWVGAVGFNRVCGSGGDASRPVL